MSSLFYFFCLFHFTWSADLPTTVPPVAVNPGYYPGIPGSPGYRNPYYNQGAETPILTYSNEPPVDGNYAFSFTTADGKQAQENGFLKDAFIDPNGEPQGTQVMQGSYSYISPEGTPIQVSYIADENGFRPSGVHIPADGRAAVFDPLRNDTRFDPAYNRYNPFNRNGFYPGQYNHLGYKNGYHNGRNGYYPGQHGNYPGQNGYYPGQNGYYPGQNGYYPGQNGYHQGHSGYYPGQNGYYPGQNGYYPGHNGYHSGYNGYEGQYNPYNPAFNKFNQPWNKENKVEAKKDKK